LWRSIIPAVRSRQTASIAMMCLRRNGGDSGRPRRKTRHVPEHTLGGGMAALVAADSDVNK
jgi:hypothetical protein